MTPVKLHATLFGQQPSDIQSALYVSGMVGYSDKAFDEDRFRGVVVLTLLKTMRGSIEKPSRVILFVPSTHEKWVIDQFDKVARAVYGHLKTLPGPAKARVELANLFGNCFKAVFVGSRLLQLPDIPEAWTSFGFMRTDPIPDWMRDALFQV